MRKRDRDVSKLEPKTLEGELVGYTEGDNGYLVYVHSTRKVVAVRDVIIKDSEVGSIPGNTETPNLLDERSPQLGSGTQMTFKKTTATKRNRANLLQ